MNIFSLNSLLRLDAVTCVAMGALLLAATHALSPLLALEPGLLQGAGLFLLLFAAFVALVAKSATPQNGAAIVISVNVAWVVASLLLVPLASPNALGTAFVLAQAVSVALIAALQIRAIRAGARA